MTEKRYTYSVLNNCQYSVNYTTFEEIYGEENVFHCRICEVNNKKQAQKVVDLLNEKEERIRELEKENERLKEKEEYCDNICKSFGDYYGMNIENAEWFGFNGDTE